MARARPDGNVSFLLLHYSAHCILLTTRNVLRYNEGPLCPYPWTLNDMCPLKMALTQIT